MSNYNNSGHSHAHHNAWLALANFLFSFQPSWEFVTFLCIAGTHLLAALLGCHARLRLPPLPIGSACALLAPDRMTTCQFCDLHVHVHIFATFATFYERFSHSNAATFRQISHRNVSIGASHLPHILCCILLDI